MEITNITKEKFRKMFEQGKRFDQRDLLDFRESEIKYNVSNKAEGSARVKIGKTDIVIGIKLALGEPFPDSPDQGNLICSAELLPLASPRFELGPPGFEAIELGRLVDRSIRESGAIDFKKLVITPGEKVWNVFIDIYPINDDGNLIDAANIGAMAALRKVKIPALDEAGKIDYKKKSTNILPLIKEILPLSFSFYKLGDSIVLDPTREEEEACDSRITFGVSQSNKEYIINSCQKSGEDSFTEAELIKIMEILPKKFNELSEKLKNFL